MISSPPEVRTHEVLKTHRLSMGYGEGSEINILFNELDLSLCAGQLVCLMGPNGVGKSTLIRTLAGLQTPLGGEVEITSSVPEKKENNISVVLTDRIVTRQMTVREMVTYGRYPYLNWNIRLSAHDHEMIDRSMTMVHLEPIADRKLFELSDGQMQMTMIARALAQDTKILLLDEPTAHLDLNNRVEIMNLLRNLSRTTGKAILMATHELDLALQTADKIWLATLSKSIKADMPEDLVLDGSFDEVFQFKGYDLRTGKVNQEAHLGRSVNLSGNGYEYLWTKNALERNGFGISSSAEVTVTIERRDILNWHVGNTAFKSLYELIEELKKG